MTKAQIIDPKTGVATTPKQVLVEDSITHQSGDGVTTGMAAAVETPDIFDNSPQAAVKTQAAPNQTTDNQNTVTRIADEDREQRQQQAEAVVTNSLHTLPDGSVDIMRDN